MKMQILWQETTIEAVMTYFVKGYEPNNGTIANYEWVHDPRTGKVAVKLYVEEHDGARVPLNATSSPATVGGRSMMDTETKSFRLVGSSALLAELHELRAKLYAVMDGQTAMGNAVFKEGVAGQIVGLTSAIDAIERHCANKD